MKASPTSNSERPEYQVTTWPVERVKAYDRNARKHSQVQIRQLRSSFQKYGQVWPILVRVDGTIIAGHGRLEAAKAEGFDQVRVLVAEGWTDEQCRAFGLLDNQVALNAEWDQALLGAELSELRGMGVDLEILGFDRNGLDELLAGGGTLGHTDPDDAPERPKDKPVSAAGDLWLLGKHRLLCGDSSDRQVVARVLNGSKPHLMVSDPPYGVEYDPAWRQDAGIGSKNAATHWQHEPVFYAERDENEDKTRGVPGDGALAYEHEEASYVVRVGKTGHWSGGRRQSTVWMIEHLKSDTGHGTQKPVECMRRPIENNSLPGDGVYEPFSGSGTTIIAAEMTGRHCYAVEIDPAYIDVAVKRWQDFTQAEARLEGDSRTFAEVEAERKAAH